MGVFDLFGKEPKTKNERKERIFGDTVQPVVEAKKPPVSVFSPESYDDVAAIIDALRVGKNAVVHLDRLKEGTSVNVLNILSGAVYALCGGLYEIEKNVYMFSPGGVEISK